MSADKNKKNIQNLPECREFSQEGAGKINFEDKAYYLWENYLPKECPIPCGQIHSNWEYILHCNSSTFIQGLCFLLLDYLFLT